MNNTIYSAWVPFMAGAMAMACAALGLFFLRSWLDTRDRFFLFFSAGFWLLGLERIVLVAFDLSNEARPFVFLFRLAAFLVIAVGILDKNRR